MNEKNPEEIRCRRLAFKLLDKGTSPTAILARIPRSRSWLGQWKQRFAQAGWEGGDSRSTAPHHSPHAYPAAAVKVVVRIRKRPVGPGGAHAMRQELWRHRVLTPVPSGKTSKRWLKAAARLEAPAEPDQEAYYPAPKVSDEVVLFACDGTERYCTGGAKVFVCHTIAHRAHALAQTLRANTSTASTCAPLLEGCSRLGIPDLLQLDNAAAFTGLGRAPRVFGHFVRLALYLGLELLFLPPGDAKRNHVLERAHGTWVQSFWNKNHCTALRDLARQSPQFFAWYAEYAPAALGGLTVKQAARHWRCKKLWRRQSAQIPAAVPRTAGRVHFLRKVDAQGAITILKEPWRVSKSLVGHYVWATLDTGQAALSLSHRRSERAPPRVIKQYVYALEEKVYKLKPEFHRRARKLAILKLIGKTPVRTPTAKRCRVSVKNERVELASCELPAVAGRPGKSVSQPFCSPGRSIFQRESPRCRDPCLN